MANLRLHSLFLKNQRGQSTVEYILLIAVVASLLTVVFQSQGFKNLFGENGQFANVFKNELEYSYQHALRGSKPYSKMNYKTGRHDSYTTGESTRFFSAKDKYPQ